MPFGLLDVRYIGTTEPGSIARLLGFGGRSRWRLLRHYVWTDEDGVDHLVPSEFVTDGGSIPRWFWFILAPAGEGFRAFVHHDWDWRTTGPSPEADWKLRIRLQEIGITVRAWPTWVAVRINGWRINKMNQWGLR